MDRSAPPCADELHRVHLPSASAAARRGEGEKRSCPRRLPRNQRFLKYAAPSSPTCSPLPSSRADVRTVNVDCGCAPRNCQSSARTEVAQTKRATQRPPSCDALVPADLHYAQHVGAGLSRRRQGARPQAVTGRCAQIEPGRLEYRTQRPVPALIRTRSPHVP